MVVRDVKGSNAHMDCKRGAVSLRALFFLLRPETLPFLKSESRTGAGSQGTPAILQKAWSEAIWLLDSFS